MNTCPCCSDRLLRHICHNHIYWYCSRCRQAMPVLEGKSVALHQEFHQLIEERKTIFPQRILTITK